MGFLLWASTLSSQVHLGIQPQEKLKKVINVILQMCQLLLSEGYCYFLDFLEIAYYPITNRFTNANRGPRFRPVVNSIINEWSVSDARELTGFTIPQLLKLLQHLRIPVTMRYSGYYRFRGEEAMLHYLYWMRVGGTKLQMSANMFGGDPRRFTYSIRLMSDHIYSTFYHKISGDSMRMWILQIHQFRYAIWDRLRNGMTIEEMEYSPELGRHRNRYVFLNVPFESWRIFGFIDDTGFRTTAPGREARRRMGYIDDPQRSFYSGYFAGHGLKVQALSLPNGMFGSVFIGAMRESDTGLLNMSGLDTYLSNLLREFSYILPDADNQLPAVYGDEIFPQLSTIVARFLGNDLFTRRLNKRMAGVRQSLEHLFGLHFNIFKLFEDADRFRLMVTGVEVSKIIFNSFFILNCYNCFNESNNNFDIRPPTLEQYIPLHEIIPPAPVVEDYHLGDVYNYSTRNNNN